VLHNKGRARSRRDLIFACLATSDFKYSCRLSSFKCLIGPQILLTVTLKGITCSSFCGGSTTSCISFPSMSIKRSVMHTCPARFDELNDRKRTKEVFDISSQQDFGLRQMYTGMLREHANVPDEVSHGLCAPCLTRIYSSDRPKILMSPRRLRVPASTCFV
jgi:hypothetical protein